MYVFFIILAVPGLLELIILSIYLRKKRKQKVRTLKNLYKLMEDNVLNAALRLRITNEQAAQLERQKPFLYMEFPQTKPLVSYLYSLNECITIGRSKENKVCIQDEELSRLHCKISLLPNGLFLQDMGSSNGTRIRRGLFQKISVMPQQQVELLSGDLVLIGRYRMKVHIYYGREAMM